MDQFSKEKMGKKKKKKVIKTSLILSKLLPEGKSTKYGKDQKKESQR